MDKRCGLRLDSFGFLSSVLNSSGFCLGSALLVDVLRSGQDVARALLHGAPQR